MLEPAQRQQLLTLARHSILAGLREGRRTPCEHFPRDGVLDSPRAAFVTLHSRQDLRGCCGSLEPFATLAEDVWRSAWTSAFADPRFPPLTDHEYEDLRVHISVLSPLQPLPAMSERELLAQLRPGVDGIVLRQGANQATFLPAVWEQLPDRNEFLLHLKRKAGWPDDVWPRDTQIWRYTTESFGEDAD